MASITSLKTIRLQAPSKTPVQKSRVQKTITASKTSKDVPCTRRNFSVAVPALAAMLLKSGPAMAGGSFGEPDPVAYRNDSFALIEMLSDMSERRAVDMAAFDSAAKQWNSEYKREHKGHPSYVPLYTATSVVKFSGGALDDAKREKLGRLVGEAQGMMREEA
ncbi:hypothetical protein CYMTET_28557 [Cymbomonas tetramitiformis]|uniref:Uncharacterized protein n=1 Tax=Cymbomonas tetramitiformis TaxID=36881 RepID=A0AAE0KW21_9CHLO|nr:hypothetical protein CYMTET_28557 [Cymbomonas tetramitiformis]